MRFDQHASPHAISRFRADQRSAVSLCSVASDRADDPLTGLATRQGLIDYLDQLLANPALDTHPAALLLLDLDRFKTMNDRMGPLVCDRLLCHVARRLRTVVPGAALIARVSGDEFAVLVSDAATSAAVADKLLDVLGRPYAVSGFAVTVGARIGIATAGEHGDSALSLLHAAGLALHQTERDGRNRVRRFLPSMQENARACHALETDLRAALTMQQVELRRALVSEQFEVHYQPQVAFADGRLTGFEALVRWRHPVRGLVPPNDFIPLAEEIGLIDLLGEWVLRTACRDAAGWPAASSDRPLRIAVNVSPLQLRDGPALVCAIQRTLAETGLAPHRLEVELTETALTHDPGDALLAIRRLGAELALDDFGTGYSALHRLRSNPFTRIKIDRSFVSDLGHEWDGAGHKDGERMIRAIAGLGIGLGLDTVAEGIETPHQYEIARQAGCTEMQGYLASRPVPATAVHALIQTLQTPFYIPETPSWTPICTHSPTLAATRLRLLTAT